MHCVLVVVRRRRLHRQSILVYLDYPVDALALFVIFVTSQY
jgi:hypothetical protein